MRKRVAITIASGMESPVTARVRAASRAIG